MTVKRMSRRRPGVTLPSSALRDVADLLVAHHPLMRQHVATDDKVRQRGLGRGRLTPAKAAMITSASDNAN
jgi:hypothetical protein